MSEYRRIVDSFDADEGYPTDEWLDAFNAIPVMGFTHREAAQFLIKDLPRLAEHISCMSVIREDGMDRIGKHVVLIDYHTGGWSGAEALIRAMLRQFWIKRLHCKWERGGHFQFEIPEQLLIPPTVEPNNDRKPSDPCSVSA